MHTARRRGTETLLQGTCELGGQCERQFYNEAVMLRLAVRPGVLHEYVVFAARPGVLIEVDLEITWRSLGAHLEST